MRQHRPHQPRELVSRHTISSVVFVLLVQFPVAATAEVRFHWEDRFNAIEQDTVVAWLTETHGALTALVGGLPFDTHLYIHRARWAGEPVPWANTERSGRQGVHFHVDPSYTLQEFRNDWTAPHELSHLVIPYLGRKNAWFAEGFASYMQYQVMAGMGVLDAQAMAKRYERNLRNAKRRYNHKNKPFAAAALRLRAERNYPTMYWGGAAFFLQADADLKDAGLGGLVDVLNQYVACCRRHRSDVDGLTEELDRLTRTTIFSRKLRRFRSTPGFPRYPTQASDN